MMGPIGFFELKPNPCPHDLKGTPHSRMSEMLACLEENGNPGFQITEVEMAHTPSSIEAGADAEAERTKVVGEDGEVAGIPHHTVHEEIFQ